MALPTGEVTPGFQSQPSSLPGICGLFPRPGTKRGTEFIGPSASCKDSTLGPYSPMLILHTCRLEAWDCGSCETESPPDPLSKLPAALSHSRCSKACSARALGKKTDKGTPRLRLRVRPHSPARDILKRQCGRLQSQREA